MQKEELIHTKDAFDAIARDYDTYDNKNEILAWMRNVVHKVYVNTLKPGSKILELNCGTGIDALFFAHNNMQVYATDISPRMISIVNDKIKSSGAKNIIGAEALSFSEINKVNEAGFDAVVSNFGGLNCINDFNKLSESLHSKLKPGGKFIVIVMNRYCPWEILYYILRLDFRNAFRRFKKTGVYADLSGEKVMTYYFSPSEFARQFSRHFIKEKIYTLGYFTPPPYLTGFYRRVKPLVKFWMMLDETFKGIFPISRFGDHFIIIFSVKKQ